MFDAAKNVGSAAVVYFVVLMSFGSYVIFNLFVAILLESFSGQDDTTMLAQDLHFTAMELLQGGVSGEDTESAVAQEIFKRRKEKEETTKRWLENERRVAGCEGVSLGCIPADNMLRQKLFRLVTSVPFEITIVVAILVSCVFLALDAPGLDPDSTTAQVLVIGDYVFVVLFSLEMVMKLVALGVWRSPSAYFRNSWNILDAFVVVMSLLSLALPSVGIIRAFRALRPLRVAVRSPRIRVVINALVRAVPSIINVFIIFMGSLLVFGILGVHLFRGRLFYCNDATIMPAVKESCVGTFMSVDEFGDPVQLAREWILPPQNFDHLGNAMVTLYQVATLSGWSPVMYSAMDVTRIGEQPVANHRPVAGFIFFFSFIFFVALFVINLFIGVVIDKFQRLRKEYEGSVFLTIEQRLEHKLTEVMFKCDLNMAFRPPKNRIRVWCFHTVEHHIFDKLIMACIVINTLCMCLQHQDMSTDFDQTLDTINTVFLAIFTMEAVWKLTAYFPRQYWKEPWNRFDFFIVVLSLLGGALQAGSVASVVRVFRVGRILRLIKGAKNLRRLFDTLVLSLPSLWNIGALLFVVFFVFSVLAMSLFGEVVQAPGGLDRHTNFETFGQSFLTLFRIATGDYWEQALNGARVEHPVVAPLFFILYSMVGGLIMLQLFIAVVLENFEDPGEAHQVQQLLEFTHAWNACDPYGDRELRCEQLIDILSRLSPPYSTGGLSHKEVVDALTLLHVPVQLREPVNCKGIPVEQRSQPHWMVDYDHVLQALAKANDVIAVDLPFQSPDFTAQHPINNSRLEVWYAQRHGIRLAGLLRQSSEPHLLSPRSPTFTRLSRSPTSHTRTRTSSWPIAGAMAAGPGYAPLRTQFSDLDVFL